MSTLNLYLIGEEHFVTLHQQQPTLIEKKGEKTIRDVKIIADRDVINKHHQSWSRHALARMQEIVYSDKGEVMERKDPLTVYLKVSRDPSQIKKLENEASFYANNLIHAQGKSVPRFYGFFTGRGADKQRLSCTVLEHVHGEGPFFETEVFRLRMLYACQIHEYGVQHNQLAHQQHSVFCGDSDIRIVDFTEARQHDCVRTYPETDLNMFDKLTMGRRPSGCFELEHLEAVGLEEEDNLTPRRRAKVSDRKSISCQISDHDLHGPYA